MSRTIRRLTFVTDAPHFGGAERYVMTLADAAWRRGIEPHVCWMRLPSSRSDVFDIARDCGLRVTEIAPARLTGVGRTVREVRAMLRRERPDGLVINACGRPRFWLVPWLTDVPAVWVQHMVDARDHRGLSRSRLGGRMEGMHLWRWPQTLRHRLAAAGATAIIAVNPDDAERIVRWQGVARDRVRVIAPGVDCQRFRFDPAGRDRVRKAWGITRDNCDRSLVLGTAARLSPEKRIDLLIEAIALLRQRGENVTAVVTGEGSDRGRLVTLARQRGIADAIRFVNSTDDMSAFYSALDVVTTTGTTESFGLALAEAMACERPVIATPTSGSRWQIDHDRNGWQLQGHEPNELAEAVMTLASDPARRQRLGQAGRGSVERRFSPDVTLEETLKALSGPSQRSLPGGRSESYEPVLAGMATEDLA